MKVVWTLKFLIQKNRIWAIDNSSLRWVWKNPYLSEGFFITMKQKCSARIAMGWKKILSQKRSAAGGEACEQASFL